MAILSWKTTNYSDFLTFTAALKTQAGLGMTLVWSNPNPQEGDFHVYCFFERAETSWVIVFHPQSPGPPSTFSADFPNAVYLQEDPIFGINPGTISGVF